MLPSQRVLTEAEKMLSIEWRMGALKGGTTSENRHIGGGRLDCNSMEVVPKQLGRRKHFHQEKDAPARNVVMAFQSAGCTRILAAH